MRSEFVVKLALFGLAIVLVPNEGTRDAVALADEVQVSNKTEAEAKQDTKVDYDIIEQGEWGRVTKLWPRDNSSFMIVDKKGDHNITVQLDEHLNKSADPAGIIFSARLDYYFDYSKKMPQIMVYICSKMFRLTESAPKEWVEQSEPWVRNELMKVGEMIGQSKKWNKFEIFELASRCQWRREIKIKATLHEDGDMIAWRQVHVKFQTPRRKSMTAAGVAHNSDISDRDKTNLPKLDELPIECTPKRCDKKFVEHSKFMTIVTPLPMQSRANVEKPYLMSQIRPLEKRARLLLRLQLDESDLSKMDVCFTWLMSMQADTKLQIYYYNQWSDQSDQLIASISAPSNLWKKYKVCSGDYVFQLPSTNARTFYFLLQNYEKNYEQYVAIQVDLVIEVSQRRKPLTSIPNLSNVDSIDKYWLIRHPNHETDVKFKFEDTSFGDNTVKRLKIEGIDRTQEYFDLSTRWMQSRSRYFSPMEIDYVIVLTDSQDWIDSIDVYAVISQDPSEVLKIDLEHSYHSLRRSTFKFDVARLDDPNFRLILRHNIATQAQDSDKNLNLVIQKLEVYPVESIEPPTSIELSEPEEPQSTDSCTETSPSNYNDPKRSKNKETNNEPDRDKFIDKKGPDDKQSDSWMIWFLSKSTRLAFVLIGIGIIASLIHGYNRKRAHAAARSIEMQQRSKLLAMPSIDASIQSSNQNCSQEC
ncbi:hypothetical protein GZH46_02021, partial [Fragariocoptes setiger]